MYNTDNFYLTIKNVSISNPGFLISEIAYFTLLITFWFTIVLSTSAEFLLDLSSVVRTLIIIYDDLYPLWKHLFDVPGTNWAKVILEMYARKIDNLFIQWSHKYDTLLSENEADFLEEVKPEYI